MSLLDPEDRERCTCGELSNDPQFHRAPCPIARDDQASAGDADVLAGLEAQLADIDTDTSGVEDVRSLTPQELLKRFAAVERELREVGQMHHQDTQEGRDLHSRRAAYMVELKRRKMR